MTSAPTLGILSLDTAFERIAGDVGNPNSYPFPAVVAVVEGADSPLIVRDGTPDEALLDRFADAARRLEGDGVAAIVSTCGFLVSAQTRLAVEVQVPMMLSALSLGPQVRASHPGRIGVLTASAAALGPKALAAAGLRDEDVAIAGMDHIPAFAKTFLVTRDRQATSLDRLAMEDAVVQVARDLRDQHPDVSAILLECGNLPPYADAIRTALDLPVFHLVEAAADLVAAGRQTATR